MMKHTGSYVQFFIFDFKQESLTVLSVVETEVYKISEFGWLVFLDKER